MLRAQGCRFGSPGNWVERVSTAARWRQGVETAQPRRVGVVSLAHFAFFPRVAETATLGFEALPLRAKKQICQPPLRNSRTIIVELSLRRVRLDQRVWHRPRPHCYLDCLPDSPSFQMLETERVKFVN